MRQRFGYLDEVPLDPSRPIRIWLHAASVGEVQVAKALISQLRLQLPEAMVLVSTVTQHGLAVATSQLPDDVPCFLAPLDLVGPVDRALRTVAPTVYVCLETELWPHIIRRAYENDVTLFLLNGRLSARSFTRYRLVRGFMEKLLSCFSKIAVIRGEDAKRFRALGADPTRIRILGNAKFDSGPPKTATTEAETLRKELALTGLPVLVTGSTRSGEEALLSEVARALRKRLPSLVWIVAPRHLERLDEVEALLRDKRIPWERLSQARQHGRTAPVILVDTMGDLATLYGLATYAFCGGSLVDKGGHNILEPIAWGKPVFYGPSMSDFLDAKELLEAAGAGFPVTNADELTAKLLYFSERPEEYAQAERRAARISERQQDSARQQVALIREVLHARPVDQH
ncbi:MAG: 3-deoxy-D-manno-octulosonic acid transferase [Thermodesulfobacteriota bacterium]